MNKVNSEVALGIAFYENGDIDKAVQHYRRAVAIDSSCAEAHAGLGIALARLDNRAEACNHLEKALKLTPDCGILANWLADAFFDQGQFDRAIELYSEALRLDPCDNNAQNDMADAYRLKGDYATAVKMYDRAIEIDPGDTNAMLEKAQCLVQLHKPEEAFLVLQKLIERFPTSRDRATAMVVYGTLLQKAGKTAEAAKWFENALEFFPFNHQVLWQAANSAHENGDRQRCAVYLQKIIDLNPADESAATMLRKVLNQ
ncbi:MAG: tetratricopeptide repeat protein [Candidatus Riflebacteria bacterium]|nr:tetratricopeptide repeat protein [Candidatus Riflebacteria bacterium]